MTTIDNIDSTAAAQGIETSFGWSIKPWGAVTFLGKVSPIIGSLVDYLKIDGLDLPKLLLDAAKAGEKGADTGLDIGEIIPKLLRQGDLVLDLVRASTSRSDEDLETLSPDQLIEVLIAILALNGEALGNSLRQIPAGRGIVQGVATATLDASRRKARKG